MVKRKHVPVLLTVAAVGVGVGIGMWLMRDRIKAAAAPTLRSRASQTIRTCRKAGSRSAARATRPAVGQAAFHRKSR